MKILGFLLILLGGALLVMSKMYAVESASILTWLNETISISLENRDIVGYSFAGAGLLLMLIGFLAGGRRDEI